MKILDRIGLALFSSLMLIISIIVCLMIFGWLSVDLVHQFVVMAINDSVSSNIMLGLSIAFILLAIKCIFFDSASKGKTNEETDDCVCCGCCRRDAERLPVFLGIHKCR